jgi:hypothetical protein
MARERIETIDPDHIRRLVAESVEQNRGVQRELMSQAAMDMAVEACYQDGELYVAAGLLMLMAARVRGVEGRALELLTQLMIDTRGMGPSVPPES